MRNEGRTRNEEEGKAVAREIMRTRKEEIRKGKRKEEESPCGDVLDKVEEEREIRKQDFFFSLCLSEELKEKKSGDE